MSQDKRRFWNSYIFHVYGHIEVRILIHPHTQTIVLYILHAKKKAAPVLIAFT